MQTLFDFSEEKDFFFFTALHYPKEYVVFCKPSENPIKGQFIRISEESKAINELTTCGLDAYNARNIIDYVRNNRTKKAVYLTYTELPIF